MPQYALEHLHHETTDVEAAVDFYKQLLGASAEPAFERAGATWVRVHVGEVAIMVTNREASPVELGRYQGFDHLGLTTDDFDGTLARMEKMGLSPWMGPITTDSGQRLVFVNGPDNIKIEFVEKA